MTLDAMNQFEKMIVDHIRGLSDEELVELVKGHLDRVMDAPKRKAKIKLPATERPAQRRPLKAGPRKTLQTIMDYKRVRPHPGRLATKMGCSLSGVRSHLALLEDEGYVVRERKGKRVCYRAV